MARLGQVQGVVQYLGSVDDVDGGVVLDELLSDQLPVLLVIINPVMIVSIILTTLNSVLEPTCSNQFAEH